MSRFSRNRIIQAAGLGEHIDPQQEGVFHNIEVEKGIVTTLILKRGMSGPGQGNPRRVYLLCPTCMKEILLGLWDRHRFAHSLQKLDTDTSREEKGDV